MRLGEARGTAASARFDARGGATAGATGLALVVVSSFFAFARPHRCGRALGTMSFRHDEFGARTPWYLTSGNRGGGMSADKRAKNSSGVNCSSSICVTTHEGIGGEDLIRIHADSVLQD